MAALILKNALELRVGAHAYNPSTEKPEAGGWLRVGGQPELVRSCLEKQQNLKSLLSKYNYHFLIPCG